MAAFRQLPLSRSSRSEQRAVSLTVRPIDLQEDRERVITYAKDLFAISFSNPKQFADQFGEDGAGYIPWIADKQASARGNAALVAMGNEAVGMVVVGPWQEDVEVGYVYHYYLEPRARGQGLAVDMDAYAMHSLLETGRATARLSVAESNTRAIGFYKRQGWTHVGPRQDQPGILYMRRTIVRPAPDPMRPRLRITPTPGRWHRW